jgi:hypothetical protein
MSNSLESRGRQRGDRDAIRAGHQLCANEFRYLRTVRVTAAIDPPFGVVAFTTNSLSLDIEQASDSICRVTTLQSPVFLLNSRPLHFCATFF